MSDRELLQVFADSDDPALATAEVTDAVSINQPGVYKRLDDLDDDGLLDSKMFGPAKAWWLTDAGREFLDEDAE